MIKDLVATYLVVCLCLAMLFVGYCLDGFDILDFFSSSFSSFRHPCLVPSLWRRTHWLTLHRRRVHVGSFPGKCVDLALKQNFSCKLIFFTVFCWGFTDLSRRCYTVPSLVRILFFIHRFFQSLASCLFRIRV